MSFHAFNVFERRKNFGFAVMNGDGVLEMSGGTAVERDDAPTIGQKSDGRIAEGDHRFDRDAKAVLDLLARSAASVVGYRRIFVHLATDAVTGELTNHTVALSFAMVLYGCADVANATPGKGGLDAEVEALFGDTKQLLDFVAHLTDTECVGGVAAKPVEVGSTVDGDYIAVAENTFIG